MLNPLTGGGGVTVNASQPAVTTGALVPAGKIIALTVLLVLHRLNSCSSGCRGPAIAC